ncbi:hypothetical protein ACN9JG_06145 [Cereibacter azotoformans]|uniref:hypothetical protein n=1 Tax=Cereibacter azotoformans TaxID=43057 RepID=UPI003B212F1E
MEIATSLGSILAAESFCGLSYDEAAVAAYIDNHVPADDMSFTSTLSVMVAGAEYSQQELSPSTKAAHCRSVERTARHYGFVQ